MASAQKIPYCSGPTIKKDKVRFFILSRALPYMLHYYGEGQRAYLLFIIHIHTRHGTVPPPYYVTFVSASAAESDNFIQLSDEKLNANS